MPDTVAVGPSHECPSGVLQSVVGAHGQRVATKQRRPVRDARDVSTRDAPVHGDIHALVAEVIGYRQTLEAPRVGQAVADEVHAAHLVDVLCDLQRHTLRCCSPGLLAPMYGQVGLAVQPVHTLVVHVGELGAQHAVDAPVAKAPARVGNVGNLATELFSQKFVT